MAILLFNVSNYQTSLHSPLERTLGGQRIVQVAAINCTGSSGGLDHRLIVLFQARGVAAKPNYHDAVRKVTYLIRPHSEFQWYVDLSLFQSEDESEG